MLDEFKREFELLMQTDELSQSAIYNSKKLKQEFEIKGVLQRAKINKALSENRIIADVATFFTSLEFEPCIYDELSVGNETYVVMSVVNLNSHYKLELEANRRNSGVHTKGRYR